MNEVISPEYVLPAIFTHYTCHGRDKLYRLIKAGKIRAKRTDSGRMLIDMTRASDGQIESLGIPAGLRM